MCSCGDNVAEYYDQSGKYARLWTGTTLSIIGPSIISMDERNELKL